MSTQVKLKDALISDLKEVIINNSDFDFRKADIKGKKILRDLQWNKADKNDDDMLLMLRAYQRVLRIVPKGHKDMAMTLLEKGIHSALQVAVIPKDKFVKENIDTFNGNKKLAEDVHKNAVIKRSQLVAQYMDVKQNNEPHAKAAKI